MDKIETLAESRYLMCIEDHIVTDQTSKSSKEKIENIKYFKNKKNIKFCPSICYQAVNGRGAVSGFTSLITQVRTSVRTGNPSCQNLLSTRLKVYFGDNMANKWSRDTIVEENEEKEESEEMTEVVIETTLSNSATKVEHKKKTVNEVVEKKNVIREEIIKLDGEQVMYQKKNSSKVKKIVLSSETSETWSPEPLIPRPMSPAHVYEELIPGVVRSLQAPPVRAALALPPSLPLVTPSLPPVPPARNRRNSRVIPESADESKSDARVKYNSPDNYNEQELISSREAMPRQEAERRLIQPLARGFISRVSAMESSQQNNVYTDGGTGISTSTIPHLYKHNPIKPSIPLL